jgi:NAD(P)-dependent dehydrogenase (short-subunit alcohol dehydrogenase family)
MTQNDKVWFVTGASKGLGLEIVRAALAAGAKVVGAVRDHVGDLNETLDHNENLLVIQLDVRIEDQAQKAVSITMEKFGRIDVLVNNAGYSLLSGIEEASDEEARKQFDTNVFGVLNVLRAALPVLRKQRSGHIINISALYGFAVSLPGYGIYGATKFAVEAITEGLSVELAPLGIKATVVEPGMFTTSLLDKSSMQESKVVIEDYAATVGQIRNAVASFNGKQPGDPAKFGKAILALANSDNPPGHLPIGRDAADVYRIKAALMTGEMEQWKAVTDSTDHSKV